MFGIVYYHKIIPINTKMYSNNYIFGMFLQVTVYLFRRAHVLFSLCLFTYSVVQYILCYVFVLFFFVLNDLRCQFLWTVQF